MDGLFRDMGIRQKLAIAPVLIVVAALCLGVLVGTITSSQDRALETLYHGSFSKKQIVNDLARTLEAVGSGLYRSITWQNAGADDATVKGAIAATLKRIDGIALQLDALQGRVEPGSAEAGTLAEVRAAATAYAGKAREVLDMLDSDPVMAVTLLRQAERLAAKVEQAVADWSELQTRQNDALFDRTQADSRRSFNVFVAIMVAAFGGATLLILQIGRGIHGAVAVLTGIMTRLAAGDRSVEVSGAERRDELGDMARAVQVFKDHAIENERLRSEHEEDQRRVARERAAALSAMADRFEATVKAKVAEVDRSSIAIGKTANVMAQHSEHSGASSLDVGDAARNANERAAVVAEATRQLALSVNEIAEQVGQSSVVARQAVDDVNSTAGHMRELSLAVQSIGEVVQLINDIAAQTNLLALNATIEAARAGEAGKGFAVVANEVKNLANQTARATDDISRQVETIQASTAEMTRSIEGVVETIRRIDHGSAAIAGAVQEQEATTRDIAANIEEVAHEIAQVSSHVGKLAQTSIRSCAGTVRVIWSAGTLNAVVTDLLGEVDRFLGDVRPSSPG
ncbi:MAG: methyl-accepting chemotaxis protein [Actinomycetota bacterium]